MADYNTSEDTWIDSVNVTTNYGGNTLLKYGAFVGKGTANYASILANVDLTSIPSNATIHAGATFSMYCTSVESGGGGNNTFLTRIVRSDWLENYATWNKYSTGTSPVGDWSGAGATNGIYDTNSTNQKGPLTGPTAAGWWTINDMETLVQDAIDNRSGWLRFKIWRYLPAATAYHLFGSRTHANKPKLTFAYNTPPGARFLAVF